jgi:hypothetical protein
MGGAWADLASGPHEDSRGAVLPPTRTCLFILICGVSSRKPATKATCFRQLIKLCVKDFRSDANDPPISAAVTAGCPREIENRHRKLSRLWHIPCLGVAATRPALVGSLGVRRSSHHHWGRRPKREPHQLACDWNGHVAKSHPLRAAGDASAWCSRRRTPGLEFGMGSDRDELHLHWDGNASSYHLIGLFFCLACLHRSGQSARLDAGGRL